MTAITIKLTAIKGTHLIMILIALLVVILLEILREVAVQRENKTLITTSTVNKNIDLIQIETWHSFKVKTKQWYKHIKIKLIIQTRKLILVKSNVEKSLLFRMLQSQKNHREKVKSLVEMIFMK